MRKWFGLPAGVLLITGLIFFSGMANAQSGKVRWKRQAAATQPELQLFHSPHAVDLPTATTLRKWDVEFEISHRFVPTLGEGIDNLYGLDGPVDMRIALGLALSNRLVVTAGRSNVQDNIDLDFKLKILQLRSNSLPLLAAVRAGGAWNSRTTYARLFERDKTDKRNFQAFGQLILNTLLFKKLGVGVVPSYLYNADIRWVSETKDILRLGAYLQYYMSPLWSVLVEWSPYISGYKSGIGQENNPLTFGIELETGGHFFKIFLTNNKYLNSSQYLAGADIPVSRNDWRLGFGITRLLKFVK